MLQEHILEESSFQLVEEFTRSENTRNGISRSCIDHIYSNVPLKCDKPKVIGAGDSDHLAVLTTKYTHEPVSRPQTILKRNYKNFNVEHFLIDVYNSGLNQEIMDIEDVEDAVSLFQDKFRKILDKHAPIKKFFQRKHYLPYITNETKHTIK